MSAYDGAWTRAERAPAKGRARADQLERLAERLGRILETSRYIQPKTRRSQELKVRRLVGRLELSSEDAQVVEGMLRQVEWKLGR